MTLIVAYHLIEGPILASDSRATLRRSKQSSDTATKILPLTESCIVGLVGNPHQAAAILLTLRKLYLKDKTTLEPNNIESSILEAARITDPIDITDSRCKLIFCYLDMSTNQKVSVQKLRFHWEKEGKPIVPGEQALPLIMHLMSGAESPKEIEFYFPRSHILELNYPFPSTRKVQLLEMDAWGSGSEYAKKQIERDYYKLWSLESHKDIPWFKTMIIAISMEDIIKNGKEYFIGGFPQVVALTPTGIHFQSYEKGTNDTEIHTTMKYNNGYWEQMDNTTGKLVKTTPGIFGERKYDESEIVDFRYFD